MGEYSFTDLNKGDSVLIVSGKNRGKEGTIEEITASNYHLKLDTGEFFSARHGSTLLLLERQEHGGEHESGSEECEKDKWHIY